MYDGNKYIILKDKVFKFRMQCWETIFIYLILEKLIIKEQSHLAQVLNGKFSVVPVVQVQLLNDIQIINNVLNFDEIN